MNPLSAVPYYRFGQYWQERGDMAQAESWLRKAVSRNPNDAQAHHLLGEFLIAAGQRDEGLVHYRKSLELQPINPQVAQKQYDLVEKDRVPEPTQPVQ